jgi:putative ABC transport system permease protein
MFSPWSELRFASRRLRRAPVFVVAVVLVLALGVGAATAVFSLVNGILLEPLPFPEPDRLVRLTHSVREPGPAAVDQSEASVLLYQGAASAFEGVAAWAFADGNLGAFEQDEAAIRVRAARVTSNFFDVLGVHPVLGRGFAAGEDRPGKNHVVVLSHRVWQGRFGGDPNAIGRQVVVNDVTRTIVGIMAPRFAYPANHVEVWLPLSLDPAQSHSATFGLVGIARLKRGVSAATGQADLARVLGESPAVTSEHLHIAPQVRSLRDSIVGPVSRLLWLALGCGVLVLLVACTNVAGLFVVRAEGMQRELAVRGALGSGLAGALALSLSESLLLGGAAGGAGLLLATLAVRAARSSPALSLPRLEAVGLDGRVAGLALAVTATCALAVSLVPLLRARRAPLAHVLQGASLGSGGGRFPGRARSTLVVAQIALSVVLVAASGLMTRSFLRLNAVRPGFDPEHVVTSRVLLPFARYEQPARLRFFDRLVREAKAIPGVRDAGLTDWVPLSADRHDVAFEVDTQPVPANHAAATVDSSYFESLRIPLLRGRAFAAPDVAHPADEAIVSRAFAERYWPGASPVGKRVRPLGGAWLTIVGEVGDAHYDGLDRPASEMVYLPIVNPGALSLVVRTGTGEGETLSAIRGIMRRLDPAVPTYDEGPLQRLVDEASGRARALAVLLAAASAVTSLLAAVGLYGIMEHTVSMRRRELGIRMALGAHPRELRRMVSRDGLRLAGSGIAIGIVCALPALRLLRTLLYGVSPTDVVTLTVTPLIAFVVAFVATWVPARHAAAVDPGEALRLQ